jgi:ABC-type nitrate/sulfonate/bicarbonate transport system permease component
MEAETQVAAPANGNGKIGVPLRIGAVILALAITFFSGAIIAGASDNTSLPTCHDVNHGTAQLPASGDCFKGSTRRADAGLGFAIAGGVAAAVALVLSIIVAATGRRGREFLIACGAALVLTLVEIAVIHI